MNLNDYQKLALRTINKELTAEENLLNACLGLAGETGEFVDICKKKFFHGHEFDGTELVKELGDILWYISQASFALQSYFMEVDKFTLEAIAKANIEKLEARYQGQFSSEKSINRFENRDE